MYSAARGLDLPEVSWIVQYDPPGEPSEYIHRVPPQPFAMILIGWSHRWAEQLGWGTEARPSSSFCRVRQNTLGYFKHNTSLPLEKVCLNLSFNNNTFLF